MKIGQRQDFSIKCQCIITKNGMLLNNKKKSKFSLIILDFEKKRLTVQPFGNTKEEQGMIFMISKLKTIHKKYIEQGKITIQFVEKIEKIQLKGVNISATEEKIQLGSQILISSASKENLQLLINKIIAIKRTQNKGLTKQNVNKSSKQHLDLPKIIKKKPNQYHIDDDQQKNSMVNRRQLLKNIYQKPDDLKIIQSKPKEIVHINVFDLPDSLIHNIFEYCQLTLNLRVVNKKFSEYILENIGTIRLKDDIDEFTFNKLCKWAINIQCRMKNVKSIRLNDKYEHQELVKNRAKTLKFGNWKEISAKNILQLKGLRLYSVQIPYQIKFSLTHLFGIRMVELHLKSNSLNKNQLIKSQDLAYIFKSIDLKVLQIACVNSDFLIMIERPQRIQQLKLYHITDNLRDQSWLDLKKYEKLKRLSIWYVEKAGIKKQKHQLNFQLPQLLLQLQIGDFIANESLHLLPTSLQYIKLIGENFYNSHVENMYLPKLKLFDITQSLNIRQQCLECLQNIKIRTNWQRNTVDYVAEYANSKNITVITINPKFK